MNNYWNHEPEFFWYKKKSEKSGIFESDVRPTPSSRFFEKIPDVIFLRPLKITLFSRFVQVTLCDSSNIFKFIRSFEFVYNLQIGKLRKYVRRIFWTKAQWTSLNLKYIHQKFPWIFANWKIKNNSKMYEADIDKFHNINAPKIMFISHWNLSRI